MLATKAAEDTGGVSGIFCQLGRAPTSFAEASFCAEITEVSATSASSTETAPHISCEATQRLVAAQQSCPSAQGHGLSARGTSVTQAGRDSESSATVGMFFMMVSCLKTIGPLPLDEVFLRKPRRR